jgi:hypothetical protein
MRYVVTLSFALLLAGSLGFSAKDSGCKFRGERAELTKRASPLDSAVGRLGDAEVKLCYSRPSARGRTIMGGLVPFDQPWRLGANEATTLYLPVAARFGDVTLKPGLYSLYAIPGAKSWQLVVNASAARWGIPIDAAVRSTDVGTTSAPSEQIDAPVEMLTMRFEPAGEGALTLVTEWERTRVRVTIRRS